MKAGFHSLTEMAAELERQNAVKADYVVDTREMTMLNGTELHLPNGIGEQSVLPLAHGQIASRLKIPKRYYDRLLADHPQLLDLNVNGLFQSEPERRMVRTLDGRARAFLSDRYRRRDNFELAQAVFPVLKQIPDAQVLSCNLTDTRMYIKVVSPRLQADVKVGDTVQAGVSIENSEVGLGALVVRPLIFRLICLNGMVSDAATRHYHVGKQVDADENYEVYSDETLRLDDQAFFAKVGDTVQAAVTEARFQEIVASMRETTETAPMKNPIEGVKVLANRYSLTEGEEQGILTHLISEGDLSLYGALNAVTRASQDVEDYDRASEMEKLGGTMLTMAASDWREVATAA